MGSYFKPRTVAGNVGPDKGPVNSGWAKIEHRCPEQRIEPSLTSISGIGVSAGIVVCQNQTGGPPDRKSIAYLYMVKMGEMVQIACVGGGSRGARPAELEYRLPFIIKAAFFFLAVKSKSRRIEFTIAGQEVRTVVFVQSEQVKLPIVAPGEIRGGIEHTPENTIQGFLVEGGFVFQKLGLRGG